MTLPNFTTLYGKHFLTTTKFLRLVAQSLPYLPRYVREYVRPTHFTAAEREKMFVATTETLGCRWCRYIHSTFGEALADDAQWIYQFGDDPLSSLSKAFAAQFIEVGNIDEAWKAEATRHYGAARARTMFALLQWMSLSNLCGNTVDATLERWRHGPQALKQKFVADDAAVPSLLSLGFVTVVTAIFGAPMLALARRIERKST